MSCPVGGGCDTDGMRRLVLLFLIALLAAACSSSSDEQSAVAADTAEEAPEAVDEAEPAEEPTAAAEPEPTEAPTVEPTPVPEPTEEPTPEPTATPEPAALDLASDGPYDVGVATVTVNGESERPLTVEVWFPLAPDAGADDDPVRYTFLTGDFYESPRAVATDAADLATDGPFPLVVYTHGSGGIRFVHSDYTEVLASHGYVVAAPDHTGNTSVEQFLGIEDEIEQIALNRPLDVIEVIDAFTDPADAEAGPYAAMVNADQIAVTGHSFGGFTSYAVVSGYENDLGASPADDRVDAIIPLAPAVGPRSGPTLLTDDALAAVDVPALVMVGTDDKTTPVNPNVERAWEFTQSSPHYRLELVAAEHQSFTDVCDYLAAFEAGQEVTDPVRQTLEEFGEAGCSADDMPADRVQELTNTFAVRFLDSVFSDGEMFSVEDVTGIEDIIYDVK